MTAISTRRGRQHRRPAGTRLPQAARALSLAFALVLLRCPPGRANDVADTTRADASALLPEQLLQTPGCQLLRGTAARVTPEFHAYGSSDGRSLPWAHVTFEVTESILGERPPERVVEFITHNVLYLGDQGKPRYGTMSGIGFIYPSDQLVVALVPVPGPAPPPATQWEVPASLRGYRFCKRFWVLKPSPDGTPPDIELHSTEVLAPGGTAGPAARAWLGIRTQADLYKIDVRPMTRVGLSFSQFRELAVQRWRAIHLETQIKP